METASSQAISGRFALKLIAANDRRHFVLLRWEPKASRCNRIQHSAWGRRAPTAFGYVEPLAVRVAPAARRSAC